MLVLNKLIGSLILIGFSKKIIAFLLFFFLFMKPYLYFVVAMETTLQPKK